MRTKNKALNLTTDLQSGKIKNPIRAIYSSTVRHKASPTNNLVPQILSVCIETSDRKPALSSIHYQRETTIGQRDGKCHSMSITKKMIDMMKQKKRRSEPRLYRRYRIYRKITFAYNQISSGYPPHRKSNQR